MEEGGSLRVKGWPEAPVLPWRGCPGGEDSQRGRGFRYYLRRPVEDFFAPLEMLAGTRMRIGPLMGSEMEALRAVVGFGGSLDTVLW